MPHKSSPKTTPAIPLPPPRWLAAYVSHAGLCARRKAIELIKTGAISVNGKPMASPTYQPAPEDIITYQGEVLKLPAPVYLLFNKPKGCLTTLTDPRGRKTIYHYLQGIPKAHIYPVGRLDRDTTGLLLLTNDGILATRLAHPACAIPKQYDVTLGHPLRTAHLQKLQEGITLPDGPVTLDSISLLNDSPKHLRITIHIGRNRIIRRLFEALGYPITHLDRSGYAHLSTTSALQRGRWRHLHQKEVGELKQLVKL